MSEASLLAQLTWLADANAAGTVMTWLDANSWATGLTIDGVSGWRLPDTLQPDASCDSQNGSVSYGYNCTGSEMGNMFYNVPENTAGSLSNAGPFSNVQSNIYWSATETAPSSGDAFAFDISFGNQVYGFKSYTVYAWAVQSGDVSAMPVPATAWLFGSGLIGLVGFAKRKKT